MAGQKRYSEKRKSGITGLGVLPWGTHFCQFYDNPKQICEVLIPYFKAGLSQNEACIWIAAEPLAPEEAREVFAKDIRRFEARARNGQIEIIPYEKWIAMGAQSGKAIITLLDKAIENGFDGLRLACNVSSKAGSKRLIPYGSDSIARYNVIGLFAYPRKMFHATGLMEVVKQHRYALLKNANTWDVIESSEARVFDSAIKRSEEKLQSLFRNMSEGFAYHRIILDASRRPCNYIFLEANESFERLTGLKVKNLIGRKATDVLPGIDSDPADWIGRYGRVAMTGEPAYFESYSVQLQKWYSVSAFSPHKGFFAATFSDITDRKRFEDALRESELRYRSFVQASAQVVWTTNERGEVRMDIPAWQAYTGQTAEQARGFGWMNAIHPDDRERVAAAWAKAFESRGIYEVEYRLQLHDGTWRDILARGVPVFEEAGNIREYVGTCIDITRRKQAEEEVLRVAEELKRSNQELEQFAYVASHDLQEPLRTINGFLTLLENRYKPQLDDKAQKYIKYAVEGGDRMSQLIRDLLEYSRVETQGKSLQLVQAREALDKALANLRGIIQESGASITHEALPTVLGDSTQLSQVFQNLIGNAIKFCRPDRPCQVHIGVSRQNGFWEFSVRDNGIGIERPYFETIFKIFQRLHTRDKYEGTGIGLTVCKKIVERHGGSIWLESTPGEGTTFFFTLQGT